MGRRYLVEEVEEESVLGKLFGLLGVVFVILLVLAALGSK